MSVLTSALGVLTIVTYDGPLVSRILSLLVSAHHPDTDANTKVHTLNVILGRAIVC